jgi:hypothetical protein
MKISIHSSDGHSICIPFPTAFLASPTAVRFALNIVKRHARISMPNISPEAAQALCQSIRRIKQQYGQWELIHMESTNGDLISIVL